MDLNMTFIDSDKSFDRQPLLALENNSNVCLSSHVYSNGSAVHWGMLARLQNDREYS